MIGRHRRTETFGRDEAHARIAAQHRQTNDPDIGVARDLQHLISDDARSRSIRAPDTRA